MTGYFNDMTNRFDSKQVLLQSKNGQYYCENNHPIQKVTNSIFFCNQCKKEYMGPLLYK